MQNTNSANSVNKLASESMHSARDDSAGEFCHPETAESLAKAKDSQRRTYAISGQPLSGRNVFAGCSAMFFRGLCRTIMFNSAWNQLRRSSERDAGDRAANPKLLYNASSHSSGRQHTA